MSPSNKDSSLDGWQRFAADHDIGDVLDGTVVSWCPSATSSRSATAYGLLHEATLNVGESVRVRLAEIDADKHRARLTID